MKSTATKKEPSNGAVAGVLLENSKDKLTIYEALKKRLLKAATCLALLEAQAATGGIIDPINNLKLPVEEAVRKGIVGAEMKEKLLSAERAIRGYTDPYTNRTISVYQAIQKDVIPKDHGVRLLEAQITTKGIYDPVDQKYISVALACEQGHLEKDLLAGQTEALRVFYNPTSQENLTYTELRGKCTVDPETNLLLLPVGITFKGLRRGVSSIKLLESKIIDNDTYASLQIGKTSTQDVMLLETVKEYLEGKGSIAGVAVLSSDEKMSIYEATKKNLIMPGTALILLEAQAATGFMIDPVKNKLFSVDDAVKSKLVGPEYHAKLLSAEQAVTGYRDPYTGNTLSLFQALSKELIVKEHGIRLLEAQIATGGIIDPINSVRVPVDVAFEKGLFDKEMHAILKDPGDDTKGFFDPNSKKNLTYLQLMEHCVIDPATGLCLLPLQKSGNLSNSFIEYKTKLTFKDVKVKVACGKYKGMTPSLWELLMSEYFGEQQRKDIIQQYKKATLTLDMVTAKVLEMIEHSVKTTKVTFHGIREKVTPKQLLDADIITEETFQEINEGKKSAKDVTEEETVQTYLQGKSSIAGVLLPDSQIMTIYQAQRKGKLRPGTTLILLEAQAATGFIIDPVSNRRFSVDDAVKANIVGPELHAKLCYAEKAVTGYKDPWTGGSLSLFQAMQKGFILQDHGIRLLEAQIATGGIIDPINSLRIPPHIAYQRGYFDKGMNQVLCDPTDDTKGFFDPNTDENLTYMQLMSRCVLDPATGLYLLPLKGKDYRTTVQEKTKEIFQAKYVPVKYGRFKNKQVTLWDLLNSEYLSEDKRQELIVMYKRKQITTEQIITIIVEIVETKEIAQQAEHNFESLRGYVSSLDLLKLKIIEEATYKALLDGKLKHEDILEMEAVKRYLCGTSCVAGVVLKSSNQKMSLYEAKKKNLLTPGTTLNLLEAQAATGFIIDPVLSKKLTVEEALKQKVIGPELYEKLRTAEKAVTGYEDPYTGKKISLFQAMEKGLILKQHGIRLLEAQIATGGIIDPLKTLHLPIEVAYALGYFDAQMKEILEDPKDDTKGFLDPNTQQNRTYKEMTDLCIKDEATGFLLLPITDKKAAQGEQNILSYNKMQKELENRNVAMSQGPYSGKTVSLWELIHSGYFTDEQRQQFFEKYQAKLMTIEDLTTMVTSVIKRFEQNKATQHTSMGLRRPVSAEQLFISKIIDSKTLQDVQEGKLQLDNVTKQESVKRYLKGTGSIAGLQVLPSKEVLSIYEAKIQELICPDTAMILLENQTATGFVINPITNKSLTVDEAVKQKVIGPDLHEHLLSVERAVTGYTDPYTDQTISLFEAMKTNLILRSNGLRLLDAQIATGGIIDPHNSHRLPVDIAKKNGYIDEETLQTLSKPPDDIKCFPHPETKENLTYLQLRECCVKDPETGLLLLPVHKSKKEKIHTDNESEMALKNKSLMVDTGKFAGKRVTLWDVLFSDSISTEKRKQLIEDLRAKKVTLDEIGSIVTAIITEETSNKHKYKGLRRQVSASELFESKIISKEMLGKLMHNEITDKELNEMKSVQQYLGATNCIAGIFIQSTKQTMSINQAKNKGLLTPGTSLVLLEAQAATGFVIDPVKNKKLSVEEAVSAGVVGVEWKDKLLSAERAVTGYTDPYTGKTISLFQALKKDLIVKDHGVRLLEAQIATGGIIDPVYSHRVPVEVAYQRGYFDQEMNQILSDPSDDTKGFFDPNTKENLTYLQLIERCVRDPNTGLNLLVIAQKGEFYFFVTTITTTTTVNTTEFQGIRKSVTASELLNSKIIDENLFKELSAGKVTVDEVSNLDSVRNYLRGTCSIAGVFIQSTKQTMSINQAKNKGLLTPGTSLVLLEAQAATGFVIDPVKNKKLSVEEAVSAGVVGVEWKDKLLSAERAVTGYTDPYTGKTISLFQALKKDLIVKDHERCVRDPNTDFAQRFKSGSITIEQFTELVLKSIQEKVGHFTSTTSTDSKTEKQVTTITTTTTVNTTEFQGIRKSVTASELLNSKIIDENLFKELSAGKVTVDEVSNLDSVPERAVTALKKDLIVKDHGVRLLEAQIATGGIIDPVYSHRVPVEVAYQRGYFDQEMNQILSDPSDDTKGFFDPNTKENLTYLQLIERCVRDPNTGLNLLVIAQKGCFGRCSWSGMEGQTAFSREGSDRLH
uniref:Epiplakin n=1 Tax=Denticeps clupeoides TaxID=299321 RepID=A0AAY4E870_9TELE